jgi:hypothetical protein
VLSEDAANRHEHTLQHGAPTLAMADKETGEAK